MRRDLGSWSIPILVGLALTVAGGACSAPASRSTPYATYHAPPTRDTAAAQRATNQGLRAIQGGDDEAAERAFREALGHDLAHAAAHNNLGLVLLRKQRWYEASWEFAYAAKLQPQAAEPKGNLGLVFEAVGRFEQAADEYEAALRLDPDNIQVMGHLARTLVKTGEPARQTRLRELLEQLALRADQNWSDWARRELIRLGAR